MSDHVTVALIGKALDAASLRHQAIANNISNANSPDYRPLRVNFEEQLGFARAALAQGQKLSASDVSGLRPVLETEPAPSTGSATTAGNGTIGNGVTTIDMEMVKLAQNTLHYQALLKALGHQSSLLSTAINEGRR
jgi:flagellar basal-body rod protein FlgB